MDMIIWLSIHSIYLYLHIHQVQDPAVTLNHLQTGHVAKKQPTFCHRYMAWQHYANVSILVPIRTTGNLDSLCRLGRNCSLDVSCFGPLVGVWGIWCLQIHPRTVSSLWWVSRPQLCQKSFREWDAVISSAAILRLQRDFEDVVQEHSAHVWDASF